MVDWIVGAWFATAEIKSSLFGSRVNVIYLVAEFNVVVTICGSGTEKLAGVVLVNGLGKLYVVILAARVVVTFHASATAEGE